MEIVQSNTQAMLIVNNNEEASYYIEWHPWEHTYAYFPMKTNTTDQLWHLSFSWWTQKTIGWHTWFEWSLNTSIAYSWYNARMQFIAVWIYQYWWSSSNNYRQLLCLWNSMLYNEYYRSWDYWNGVQVQTQNSSSWSWSWWKVLKTSITSWQWYLLAYWYDWSKWYLSVNWENYREIWWPSSSAWYSWYSYFMYGWSSAWSWWKMVLWATIYEDQMRSQQDLTKYFNKTKKDYWYS